MSILDRRELLANKEKANSFAREIADMILMGLESLDESRPFWEFGQLFRDCELRITVSLLKEDEGEDDEPSHGHPTVRA